MLCWKTVNIRGIPEPNSNKVGSPKYKDIIMQYHFGKSVFFIFFWFKICFSKGIHCKRLNVLSDLLKIRRVFWSLPRVHGNMNYGQFKDTLYYRCHLCTRGGTFKYSNPFNFKFFLSLNSLNSGKTFRENSNIFFSPSRLWCKLSQKKLVDRNLLLRHNWMKIKCFLK